MDVNGISFCPVSGVITVNEESINLILLNATSLNVLLVLIAISITMMFYPVKLLRQPVKTIGMRHAIGKYVILYRKL